MNRVFYVKRQGNNIDQGEQIFIRDTNLDTNQPATRPSATADQAIGLLLTVLLCKLFKIKVNQPKEKVDAR